MNRVRVKICGLTRQQDLLRAAELGADALGLVFAEGGPRSLTPTQALKVASGAPAFVPLVALFMDSPAALVQEVITTLAPALLQFHGSENPEFCDRWGIRYLRVVPMSDMSDARAAARFCDRYPRASGFVFDGHGLGEAGGQGRTFDWRLLPGKFLSRGILAGGLTPDNVREAVTVSGVSAVDVSSGVELKPGIKDEDAMRRFIKEVSNV